MRCAPFIGIRGYVAFDPCCGEGHMVKPLAEYALHVFGSDIHDYGAGFKVQDFLFPGAKLPPCDWAVFNPPFRLAEQFIHKGLEIAECGVAVLVRSVFTESVGRYERLFRDRPPAVVAQFTERVPMVKGRLDKEASSATAYCWIVWLSDHDEPPETKHDKNETRFVWIPPCRKSLERAGDYA